MEDKDKEIHLRDYLAVLKRRRLVAYTIFSIIVGATAAYSFLAPPIYEGSSYILFDFEKNPTMSFVEGESGYVQMKDTKEFFETQAEILKSRSFADRVVRKMALDKNPYFIRLRDGQNGGLLRWVKEGIFGAADETDSEYTDSTDDPFPDAIYDNELDPVLTSIVLNGIDVSPVRASNIMRINFFSENPKVAAVMANGTASTFIEHNLEIRVKPFRDAVDWLSSKLIELRSRVEQSEKVLQKYKEGEGIVFFESKESVITQKLKQLITQLVKVEAARQEAEIRYNQILSVIDEPELLSTVPDIMNNLVIQGIRTEELKIRKNISELSEKYGPKHPTMIKAKTELNVVQRSLIDEARKMLNAAKTEYEIAKSREISLMKKIELQKDAALELSRKAIEFNVVAGESWSNKKFYEMLLKKLQEASLSSGINISNAQIVDFAVIPEKPVHPDKFKNLFASILVGLSLSVLAAFLVEHMDNTLKSPDDVRQKLGLPFLATIPISDGDGPLLSVEPSTTPLAEAYRSLRTSILFTALGSTPKVILLTSSIPGEGKTTTAANLAISMAQAGEKVLLVDCDLRQSAIYSILGMEKGSGLTDIIVESRDADKVTNTIEGLANLHVITGGTKTPNPSELLGSAKLSGLIESIKPKYDRIILDSPPLLAVSDALILATLSDGIVLVTWGGSTGLDLIEKSVARFDSVDCRILGVVLNKIHLRKTEHLYYYSYYNT